MSSTEGFKLRSNSNKFVTLVCLENMLWKLSDQFCASTIRRP